MIPLPYRDENPSPTRKFIVVSLIIVNVAVFGWEVWTPLKGKEIVEWLGFVPAHPEPYRWLTSQFVHAGFFHLISNLWVLWLFGDNVEGRLRGWFLPFYLFCGSGAHLFDMAFRLGSSIPAVGASGAISGVLGAYFLLFPQARLRCVWITLIYIGPVSLRAWIFGAIYVGWQVLNAFLNPGSGVAHASHLGGAVFGGALALLFMGGREEAVALSGPAGWSPAKPAPSPWRRLGPGVRPLPAQEDFGWLLANHPERAVLAYLNRLRRDPYFALGPDDQLRVGRRLARSGQPHLARNALSKLVLRHPRSREAAAGHLDLARLEQDWFRQFAAARRHLLSARRLREALTSQEEREAERRLREVEALLGKTFAEEAADGERYWVLRESPDPLSPPQLARLAAAAGGTPASLTERLLEDPGILARNVGRQEAAALAGVMEAAGVPVLVLPQSSILVLPPPELATGLRVGGEGPVLSLQSGGEASFPWKRCLLIAAVGVTAGARQHDFIEVFELDPVRRLRWWDASWAPERYFTLLQDLLLQAQDVPVNSGALHAWDRQLPASARFPSPEALDRSISWELQLAYQKKEGLYRRAEGARR